jgi:hypothetical protein
MSGITIYRMQDRSGRGPWKPGFSKMWVEDRTEEEFAALKAIQELVDYATLSEPKGHRGCGCRTLAQLRRWFTPTEYARLLDWDYTCVQMEVDRVLFSNDVQVLFERRKPLRKDIRVVTLY